MHPSYYHRANACILVFDVCRKSTYQHLEDWYKEMRRYSENIPCICVANKIDVNYEVTKKKFKFAEKYQLPFFYVSAADGTNVVKVFQEACKLAYSYKNSDIEDYMRDVMELLDDVSF
jgi:Rab-like protein 2